MKIILTQSQYGWKDAKPTCAYEYILPAVLKEIRKLFQGKSARILDMGCGNGYVAAQIAQIGHAVVAIDASKDGIDIARAAYPEVDFRVLSLYDDNLGESIGKQVDGVIALEVVEHLFYPKQLFEQSYGLLKMGGYLILSTPYHGYLKNLATSLVNGWDRHFSVDWDGGHIKFFSKKTLAQMACNAGFKSPHSYGIGRVPGLWKSMIMVSEK
jgi:2-polyprenyl-3-methyl-5-hydroxy-6-metoxy-1,4-benzoquinol methylase